MMSEDTGITLEDIQVKFGKEVAPLVDGVTKLSRFELNQRRTTGGKFAQMFLAMAKDIRVILN